MQDGQRQDRYRQAFVIEGQTSDTEDDIPEHILKEIEEAENKENDNNQKHIFFTTDKNELSKFTAETLNAAALDTSKNFGRV